MLDSAAYYNSQFGSFEVDMMILKSYHDYYLEETNYKVANDYLEKYIELIDSNHKKEHSIALAEYEILFKNIQKEHQLEQMQKETEILRLGRRVIIAVSIAIFCLLLLTGYLLYSRYRKVKKRQTVLKEELSSKERELTSNALSLIKRNEAMKGVSSKLKDSKHKLKAENQKIVQEVINEINIELSEVGWKEFELRFLKVHPDFYPNIRKEFPDITPAEIKLSALLRLNFTTKEIASITGLSNSSVETARVRLRKKLELDSDTNLVSFLSRF